MIECLAALWCIISSWPLALDCHRPSPGAKSASCRDAAPTWYTRLDENQGAIYKTSLIGKSNNSIMALV